MLIAGAIHALLCLGIILVRDHSLRRDFDRDLRARAQLVAAALAKGSEAAPVVAFEQAVEAVELIRPDPGSITQLRASDGTLVGTTHPGLRLPFGSIPEDQRDGAISLDGRTLGRDGEPYRMVTVSAERSGERFYIQHGASLEPVFAGLRELRSLLMLVFLPGAITASGVAAWFVAHRALSRIDRVADALRAVRAGEPAPRIEAGAGADEIGEMVSEMNGMLARLEASFRAQERFIINVTHELKTPVSILLAQAQLLRADRGDVPAYREFAISVEEEMRRLAALLESFLTLARSGQGQRYVESSLVSLNEVIVEAIRRAGPDAHEKSVALVPTLGECGDEEPVLRGDGELLTTALTNLVRNAVEHSPPGAPVDLLMERDNGDCRIAVVHRTMRDDQGVLKAFARPGRRRSRELAMEVARGIAQLHGGDVWTEEAPGTGRSVLRVSLAAAVAGVGTD